MYIFAIVLRLYKEKTKYIPTTLRRTSIQLKRREERVKREEILVDIVRMWLGNNFTV